MKLLVIGCGQCGGRVADEFARLNKRARSQRGIDILVETFAINTDSADLAGLVTIKADYRHRILIGAGRTHGHGVAKITELGAEIAREDGDKVIDAIREAPHFYDADAFMLIAGAAGGTGSGVTPVMAKTLKERFVDKPVYCIVVLPFEHEEKIEDRTPYNVAVCLKSMGAIADANILVDNQRFVKKDASLANNIEIINQMIVEPFYNLLCAGEEQKSKYIGARMLDTGDIKHTLVGWTAIGYGTAELPKIIFPFGQTKDFMKRGEGNQRSLQAMNEAISELSIECKPSDAGRSLFLLSAAAKCINMDMVKELGEYLRGIAPKSLLRNGDYPRGKNNLEVTVVLSELADVPQIREYYTRSKEIAKVIKKRQQEKENQPNTTADAGKDVPSLLE